MEAVIAVGYARLNSTDCVEEGLLSYTKILLGVITRTDRKLKLTVILQSLTVKILILHKLECNIITQRVASCSIQSPSLCSGTKAAHLGV